MGVAGLAAESPALAGDVKWQGGRQKGPSRIISGHVCIIPRFPDICTPFLGKKGSKKQLYGTGL